MKKNPQNCGACWICESRFCPRTYRWSKSTEEFCKELFWPSVSTRQNYLSLTMIYDILHNHSLVITSLSLPVPFIVPYMQTILHSLLSLLIFHEHRFFVELYSFWRLSITCCTTFRHTLYHFLFIIISLVYI